MKQKIDSKKIILMMIRIGGVMALFGLTWTFGALTISVPGLRETFQILFTAFTSFQGVFIFLFFCVINKEACKSWKELYSQTCRKSYHYQVSKSSNQHKTSDLAIGSTTNADVSPIPSKSEKLQLSVLNSGVHSDLSDEKETDCHK